MSKPKRTITDAEFLGRNSKKVKISDIVSTEDCWLLEKENKWILSHKAVQEIAKVAGVSRSFEVAESPNILPNFKNDMANVVRITIRCYAKKKEEDKGCIHNEDVDTHTVTGEATRRNTTPGRGGDFLRKMAEKRGFDIAVLEHLGLHSLVFSEEEAEQFMEKTKKNFIPQESISDKELEAMKIEIGQITTSKTKDELTEAAKLIRENKTKYNETQRKFLEELYGRQIQIVEKPFE